VAQWRPKLGHSSLCSNPIYAFWHEEQKKNGCRHSNSGEVIGCLLLTEPNAGQRCRWNCYHYKREGDAFVINGSKIFINQRRYLGNGIFLPPSTRSLKHKRDQCLYRRF